MLYIITLLVLFPFEVYQFKISGFNVRYYDIICIILFFCFILDKIFNIKSSIKIDITTKIIFTITLFGFFSSIIHASDYFLTIKSLLSYIIIIFSCILFNNFYDKSNYDIFNNTIIVVGLVIALFCNLQLFLFVINQERLDIPLCNFFSCSEVVGTENFGAYGYLGGLMRPTGFFTSMNRVGTYLIPSAILSIDLFYRKRKVIYAIVFFILVESIIISLARNSIIAAFIGLGIYLSLAYRLNYHNYSYSKVLIFILTGFIFISWNPFEFEAFEHFDIFNIDARSDISNSSHFFQHFWAIVNININNFGLGQGFQEYDEYVYRMNMVETYGAHNNFLTVFGESGFFAVITYIFAGFIAIALVYKAKKNKAKIFTYFSIFIALFISGFFRTYYFNAFSFYFLVILIKEYNTRYNDSNLIN